MRSLALRVFFLAFALFQIAPSLSAQTLNMVSGSGQVVYQQFQSQPLVVQAKDPTGKPLAGLAVNWMITQGGGTLQIPSPTVTDSGGLASQTFLATTLQPGMSYETEMVTASSSAGTVTFVVTTIPPPQQPAIQFLTPTADTPMFSGAQGTTISGAIQILVVASSGLNAGQPLPNVSVGIVPYNSSGTAAAMCNGPNGLVFTNNLGIATCDLVLTGTPGSYQFSVATGDFNLSRAFNLTITPGVACTYALSATSATFPMSASNGSVNVTAPTGCTWTAVSNAPWIVVNTGGTGNGNGTVTFTISANTTGAIRSGTLTIAGQTFTVTQTAASSVGLTIATSALPQGSLNAAYAATTLAAVGGTAPYTFALTGTLPPGLTLSSAGVISGTPTGAGIFGFSVTATDSKGVVSPAVSLSITVNGSAGSGLTIQNVSFASAVISQAYSQPVQASGGCTTPFSPKPSIVLSSGSLPPGIRLTTDVNDQTVLAGTPTTLGTYTFGLKATDACGTSVVSNTFTIVVGTTAPVPSVFTAAPASLAFTLQVGGVKPADQTLAITSSPSAAPFTATASVVSPTGTNWLAVTSTATGVTPASITIGLTNFSTLPAGTYMGLVTITGANGGTPLQVPVSLTVTAGATLTVSPTALVFNLMTAGTNSSSTANLVVASTGSSVQFAVATSTTSSVKWLSSSVTMGSTSLLVGITANASGLTAGSYTGMVTITPASGAAVTIPVSLNVTGGPMLAVNSPSLSFTVLPGVTPTAQTVMLTSGPPVGYQVAIAPSSALNWLSVTPATGLTPATLSVSVNPAALSPGQSSATITISDPSGASPAAMVQVAVTVVPGPAVSAITNGATFQAGPIAPGEIVTIFGTGLGLDPLASNSGLTTSLNGTLVTFDSTPATILYESSTQVSVIVPWAIAGRTSTSLQIAFQGLRSTPIQLNLASSSLGVFTLDSSGQGAILNQDGSVNSAARPALPGSVISIFATGGGQTSPAAVDGVAPSGAATTVTPITATVNGLPATVLYAGAAPGLAGLLQVNVQVPQFSGASSPVKVVLLEGSASSPVVLLQVAGQ